MQLIIIGLSIGFYSYLFPGSINLMVLDLFVNKKHTLLVKILLLVVSFETMYCLVTLTFLSKLSPMSLGYYAIQLSAYIMLIFMGSWMTLKSNNKAHRLKSSLRRGVTSVIFHPQQIPFWLFIGMLIKPYINFEMNIATLIYFSLLNALGVLGVLLVYVYSGRWIMEKWAGNAHQVPRFIGGFYIVFGFYEIANFIAAQ